MKKDIEWLKSAIQQNLDFYNDNDEEWQMAKVSAYAKSLDLINQLEETEVLSKDWIDGKKIGVRNRIPFHLDIDYAVPAKYLQNLLVPKQELPVIPQFVVDVIEAYKSNSRLTNLLADLAFHGELAEFVEHEDEDEVFEWARSNRKATDEILARAWLDGYEVEEEQKYVVELPSPNNQMGRHKNVFLNKKDGKVFIDSASLFVNDITKYGQLALTEEEIKKDFEWAWKFAKPVEELE